MMSVVSISKDLLLKAIAEEVKRQSGGMANLDIAKIEGVIETGESFDIAGVRVHCNPPKVSDYVQRTPPAGHGKIRLAAVDGVAK